MSHDIGPANPTFKEPAPPVSPTGDALQGTGKMAQWLRATLGEDLSRLPAPLSGSSQAPVAPVPRDPSVLFCPPVVGCLDPHRDTHAYTYTKINPKML